MDPDHDRVAAVEIWSVDIQKQAVFAKGALLKQARILWTVWTKAVCDQYRVASVRCWYRSGKAHVPDWGGSIWDALETEQTILINPLYRALFVTADVKLTP